MSATTRDGLVFATRTTLAALLAALVALYVQLPQASTSMMTVFIVSQPLAGMVLSKSLYRVMGTVVGASMAIVMTVALSEAPELFSLAISAWIGACVVVSVFLRDAPQSYGALLSGYTVAIVAFPAVGSPDTIFQAAMDRSAEIFVGIVCATTLSQIFFPQTAGSSLARATQSAVASASSWAAETLRGRPDAAAVARDRRQLVTSVTRLENLRINAAFESASVRLSGRRIRLLHARLVSLLALLVSTHDRMETLRAERPASAQALKPLLDRAAEAMSPESSHADREAAKAALLAAAPDLEAMRADRAKVFERTILLRVADLVDMRGDIARLCDPAAKVAGDDGEVALSRYRDAELALVAGGAAFLSVLAFCAFWIASGWTSGAGAAIMVAVMASLFAQQDDPVKPASVFLVMTGVGSVAAAIYVFGILPPLEGFEALALALAPPLFAAAYAMSNPKTMAPALAGSIGFINLVSLTNVMTPDFATFANSALAQIVGIGLAAGSLRVLRPIGAAWPVARLTAGIARDLAEATGGANPERTAFESRMFDRIDGLMTRLDPTDPDSVAVEQGALAGLRVGLNALALRRALGALPSETAAPIRDALADLARHFRRLARGSSAAPPVEKLDAALDAALAADLGAELGARPDAADLPVWISAIRTSLAQHPRLFGASSAGPELAPEAA